ncbi:hypothetical protein chiPu_0024865 [Chiloscyllium punctatum]|uniref:Uncharacterized protein n=1 Tax=Chiloscyllium punctatum TaxID=137246 RepID=A0A401TD54_CHIPU|nr:hypothetical protein [Chiloscyllium punctatum]
MLHSAGRPFSPSVGLDMLRAGGSGETEELSLSVCVCEVTEQELWGLPFSVSELVRTASRRWENTLVKPKVR